MRDYNEPAEKLPLFDGPNVATAIARKSDPATSHVAAKEVAPRLSSAKQEFLRRLRDLGQPSTANEVAMGKDTIRKRAKELVDDGLIVKRGVRRCGQTKKLAAVYWLKEH